MSRLRTALAASAAMAAISVALPAAADGPSPIVSPSVYEPAPLDSADDFWAGMYAGLFFGMGASSHELFIDIGCRSREEAAAKLNVGDAGVFADASMMIDDDTIVARGLDNRIGTWAAAEALVRLAPHAAELHCDVVAVSTVQEEVGLHGAAMIADGLKPDVALVTDVGHATDTPGIDRNRHGDFKLGGGPKIAVGGPAQPLVVQRLMAAADAEEIVFQRTATPGRSGTDTDAIFLRNGGIPCGLVSLPIRYMHTTVETTSLADLEAIARIFARFCRDLGPDDSFLPRIA